MQPCPPFVATSPVDLRTRPAVHPVLGKIDGDQLLLFATAHCDRHRAQSEDVIVSAGFPPRD